MPAASRPRPGSRPALPRSWCTLWSAASAGPACPATPDAALHWERPFAGKGPRCGTPPRSPPRGRRRPPLPPPSRPSSPPASLRAWLPGKSTSHYRTLPPQLDAPPGGPGDAHCAPAAVSAQCAPTFTQPSTAGVLYPNTRPMGLKLLPSVTYPRPAPSPPAQDGDRPRRACSAAHGRRNCGPAYRPRGRPCPSGWGRSQDSGHLSRQRTTIRR